MAENEYTTITHEKSFKYTEGDYTVTRGSAWSGPGCHLGCGVLLYTDKDDKLVKVEGDPENPFSEGRLCARCLAVPEVTNHKDRLLYPMKRDPKDRGKDVFERVSWEEAYDLIAERFLEIKEKYGAETIQFAQGTGRDIAAYITRLAWSFGSPNYSPLLSGGACYMPRVAGCVAIAGSFWIADCAQQFTDRYDNPDYTVPEVMVVWGNYPLRSNADGFFGHWVVDLMKRGMKIIMIDPKATWLSARSEVHLRVRPGTDAALALGMLNVIINEELYDEEFVDKWCYGFDELKERVQEYPVERVADICWVPADKIREAARLLAQAKPATLQWGVAVDMTKEALPATQSILSLFAITGNIDIPGGIIAPVEILSYAGGWGQDLISEEQKAKRIGLDRYPLLHLGFQVSQSDMMIETMETGVPYQMHAIWIQTNNPIACMGADPKRMHAALNKLDFIVVVDIFMTPTAMGLADVLLPAATFPERNGIRVGDGIQRAEAINKVTTIGECKSDMQINLELGKRLNPEAWPWDNVDDMFTAMLSQTGISFEELQEQAPVYLPFTYERHAKGLFRMDGSLGFNTATGRVELWSNFLNNAGLDPLPYFEEPSPGPKATPELVEEYPYVLTTGARTWASFHSEHRQIDRLRKLHPHPTIEINPETCADLNIKEGDWVWVENIRGRAKRRVKSTPIWEKRIVSCDHGWWLPEAERENLFDVFDIAINNLVPWGQQGKSGFGANYKTTLVKIYKVKEGE